MFRRILSLAKRNRAFIGLCITHIQERTSLQNRRLQDLAALMYKVKYCLVPSNVVEIFSVKSSKYHSRNMDFHLLRFNSVHYGKHSRRYSTGPYIWPRLDSKINDKSTLQHTAY